MTVDNATFSAQYGRNSGAIANIVTRSGSNDARGELFEFLRDDALDARNFFNFLSDDAEPFSRHQFGGTFGGPLVRNPRRVSSPRTKASGSGSISISTVSS